MDSDATPHSDDNQEPAAVSDSHAHCYLDAHGDFDPDQYSSSYAYRYVHPDSN